MPIKWSPGCNCCRVIENCQPEPLSLTEGTSVNPLWTVTGPGSAAYRNTNHISVVSISGTTTLTAGHLAGRYNEAFDISFEAIQGTGGSTDAIITISSGGNSVEVDLKAATLKLNGGSTRSIGFGSNDASNFTEIQILLTPEYAAGAVRRIVKITATNTYEDDVPGRMVSYDLDETPASYSAPDISIDVEGWVEIKNIWYRPATVVWPSGTSFASINCGCGLIGGGDPLFEFHNNISELDIAVTGAQYPDSKHENPNLVEVKQSWNYSTGFQQYKTYLGLPPGDVWKTDDTNQFGNFQPFFDTWRGHVLDIDEVFPRYQWRVDSGHSFPVGENTGFTASMSARVRSYAFCPLPSAGNPYPQPRQLMSITGEKSEHILSCTSSATTTTQRDLSDLFSSFSIAVTMPALTTAVCVPSELTWMRSTTTLTFNWPGS